ncbi:hypothetical protein HMPREF0262_00170 [Clostridium sp. ATCC 29733]|nr:hypothetical protein HMPREF0262_00170 [Clostridium sp. ATCC 29733]
MDLYVFIRLSPSCKQRACTSFLCDLSVPQETCVVNRKIKFLVLFP